MTAPTSNDPLYSRLAVAFARGHLACGDVSDAEALELGRQAELRLHRFKRSRLPRVKRVLGILRGLAPVDLLDVGSGRGAFLWPLLDAFPHLPVTSLDAGSGWIQDVNLIAQGGVPNLRGVVGDVRALEFEDDSFDGVTILEVLEHLEDAERAAREVVRTARRFVIASVPSKPDDNPGHVRLFDRDSLSALLRDAGALRVNVEFVLGHMVAVARVS